MARRKSLAAAILLAATAGVASAATPTLRIVSYNIDDADQGNDNNITASYAGLPTVLQAIGQHHLGTNAQPIDVLGVEELNTTTLANLVTALNNIYGAGTYAFDHTTDPDTGGGHDGIIYNTQTVQIVGAKSLGDGTYAGAIGAGSGGSVPRSPMRYQIRPIGYGSNSDFYMYVDHARSTSDTGTGTARYAEAQEVRNDANTLAANAHILYSGDWNLFNGNNANGSPNGTNAEDAYLCLTGQSTSDGLNWAGVTQAFDPTSPTTTITAWKNSNSTGVSNFLYSDSTTHLTSRLDLQIVSSAMLNQPGLQLAPDTSDPFTNNYPSSKYHYAFEVFGNNNTTGENKATNLATNTSLNDLPNATTVLNDLMQFNAASQFVGSDHLPLVADYVLVGVTPATRFYVGSASGTWKTTASWSDTDHGSTGASIPIDGTPVIIDPAINATIVFDGNYRGTGVAELHLDGKSGATATLNQTANILTVAGAVSIGENTGDRGAYTLGGGTLDATGGISVGGSASAAGGIGQLTVNGGAATISQNLRIWNNGTMSITSGTLSAGAITNAGNFTTTGTLIASGNFTNSGTAILGGAQTWSTGSLFTNSAGSANFLVDTGSSSAAPLSVTVTGGSVNFNSTQHLNSLSASNNASITVASGGANTLVVNSVSASTGLLDLSNNSMMVQYTGLSPVASIRQMLISAYAAGDWSGNTGITSSTAHADNSRRYTLAYAEASDMGVTSFAGQPIAGDAVIVKFTYYGDNNLDGIVDLDNDFSLFVDGYNQQISNPASLNAANLWRSGDYNYDGVIDLDNDFSIFVDAYAKYQQDPTPLATLGTEIFSSDLTSAQKNAMLASVPEPSVLGLGAVLWMPVLMRRKRRDNFAPSPCG